MASRSEKAKVSFKIEASSVNEEEHKFSFADTILF